MKRWHEDWNVTRREWKEHRRFHVESNKERGVGYGPSQREPGSDPRDVDCVCDEQLGRFRKKDAHDCGRAGCQVCHADKFPKREITCQERVAELRFREQLREFFQSHVL